MVSSIEIMDHRFGFWIFAVMCPTSENKMKKVSLVQDNKEVMENNIYVDSFRKQRTFPVKSKGTQWMRLPCLRSCMQFHMNALHNYLHSTGTSFIQKFWRGICGKIVRNVNCDKVTSSNYVTDRVRETFSHRPTQFFIQPCRVGHMDLTHVSSTHMRDNTFFSCVLFIIFMCQQDLSYLCRHIRVCAIETTILLSTSEF